MHLYEALVTHLTMDRHEELIELLVKNTNSTVWNNSHYRQRQHLRLTTIYGRRTTSGIGKTSTWVGEKQRWTVILRLTGRRRNRLIHCYFRYLNRKLCILSLVVHRIVCWLDVFIVRNYWWWIKRLKRRHWLRCYILAKNRMV